MSRPNLTGRSSLARSQPGYSALQNLHHSDQLVAVALQNSKERREIEIGEKLGHTHFLPQGWYGAERTPQTTNLPPVSMESKTTNHASLFYMAIPCSPFYRTSVLGNACRRTYSVRYTGGLE